ncbi:MAG: hypothetical protein CM15mV65_430 [Caudoviricetes sp.]|nr:MAG: hypothetical protein CM15mV65_430 [Caudoviricetes sp.]
MRKNRVASLSEYLQSWPCCNIALQRLQVQMLHIRRMANFWGLVGREFEGEHKIISEPKYLSRAKN